MRDINSIDDIEFIHIPKNGGTTILTHLSTVDPVRFDVLRLQATAWQIRAKDLTAYDRRFSFAIVRNPYQRFVSVWQHILRRKLRSFVDEKEKDLWKTYFDFNVWFRDNCFCLEWDSSFMTLPQWYWISNSAGTEIVDRIWKIEDMRNCVEFLNEKLGQNFDSSIIENAANKRYNYRSITTEKTKQAMIELCKLDCKEFGSEW